MLSFIKLWYGYLSCIFSGDSPICKGVGTAAAGAAMAAPLFDQTKSFFIHLSCRRSTVNSRLLTRSVSDAQQCTNNRMLGGRTALCTRTPTYVPRRIYAFTHAVASRSASRSCSCKKVVFANTAVSSQISLELREILERIPFCYRPMVPSVPT